MAQVHNETQIFNAEVIFNKHITVNTPLQLFVKLTTTQRNALTNPQDGWIIYNTTTNKHQARAGGAWVDLY